MDYATFEQLCKKNGTSPTALTRKLGLSKGNASSWKKGGNPSADILMKLADELNCTTDKLLGRSGIDWEKTLNPDESSLLSYYNALDPVGKARVSERAETLADLQSDCKPVITALQQPANDKIIYVETYSLPASAGSGVDLDGCEKDQIAVRETGLTADANFALRVSGKSMEPEYHDGDIVLIRTQPEVEIGQVGIFIVNGMGYIKQCGEGELISLNSKYDNIHILAEDECYCRGLVIGILQPDDLME